MKILVTIVIYNRFHNLQRWLNCWKQCNTENTELIIIHTGDEIEKFKQACEDTAIYIHRHNIGFDIGSFQDVCKERLANFPNDWDYLLWCTDDTFPMNKNFIEPFITPFENPYIGLTCMQISKSKPGNIVHVRTTGFCIPKFVAKHLTFPADPVKTKQDCYHFEHRGKDQILSEQIRRLGLDVIQVTTNDKSPLWDSGFWKRLDRQNEHDINFGYKTAAGDKVTFIATIYDSYPQIISSLLLQTHKNWELILIHDGPASDSVRSAVDITDQRVKFIETGERKGKWGHYWRQWALEEIRQGRLSNPDYIVVTNSDNYYVPEFIRFNLHHMRLKHTTVATYSAKIVHSYIAHGVMECRLEKGFIDCGGVMIKRDIACEVGWRDIEDHSADWVFFSDIASKYSLSNFVKVPGCLFVHN